MSRPVPAGGRGLRDFEHLCARLATAEPATRLPVDALRPAVSPRVGGVDAEHVRELAELAGRLPPVIVSRDGLRVIDGSHRLLAAKAAGLTHVDVLLADCAPGDEFLLAVRLNANSGRTLSPIDRAAAAARLVELHPAWSDRAIAAASGLSDKTVAAARRRSGADVPQPNTRIGRDGRRYPTDQAAGRTRALRVLTEHPDASVREVAREAGVSVGTAHDVRSRWLRGEDPLARRRRDGGERAPLPAGLRRAWARSAAGRMLILLLDQEPPGGAEFADLLAAVEPGRRPDVLAAIRQRGEALSRLGRESAAG
ncbi:ParB/RepB/Spo0J family partition protein [Amycolatopsis sp. CA-128772]|uniref:ParB/RepB/Spo0J family partition protein n=1 Tax=Amycolatopsis sp. CA-128772 TaxID=2073159 RepID=UPI0011B0A650|nr:ParB/RepB/Spo0J family partition protein [Amycolatopsis sp. CA-128772]